MGFSKLILIISVIVLAFGVLIPYYWQYENEKNLEKVAEWADSNKIILTNSIKAEKYEVKYNQAEWDELIHKLNNSRYFDDQTNEPTFEFGFPIDYAKELVEHWKKDFDWKKQVEKINKYQNYIIKMEDITLHFVRVNNYEESNKGTKSKKIPLLLLNGWPSTFYELYGAIDYISTNLNNENRYFDIVVPSIPGFAYSKPLNKVFDSVDVAKVYDGLMRYLYGENCQYFVHGEDWGSAIAGLMTVLYPKRVSGAHISLVSPTYSFTKQTIFTALVTHFFPNFMLTEQEKASNITFSLSTRIKRIIKGAGYFHQQATKPDTIGYALADSPLGLMAYILEKYSIGSFSYKVIGTRDGFLNKLSRDDLLSIVTIYWMTNSITSSMRIYKSFTYQISGTWPKNEISKYSTPNDVPISIISFPYEVDHTPYVVLKRIYGNLKQYSIMPDGGHFAAFLQPKLTSDDFVKFIDSVLAEK